MSARLRQPVEADGGVHLHFNYWMQKGDVKALLPSEVQHLLSCYLSECNPQLGVSPSQCRTTKNIVVVCVNGVDTELLSEQCQENRTPFLAATSSMPVIAVRKFQSQKTNSEGRVLANPNPWFYNDVKSLESELLYTMLPPILSTDCASIVKKTGNEKLLWENSHSLIFSLSSRNSESISENTDKWLVCRPNSLSPDELAVIRSATVSKVNSLLSTKERLSLALNGKEINLSYSAGRFLVTNIGPSDLTYGPSIGKGYYFVNADSNSQQIDNIVLVWESGSVDIFRPIEVENNEFDITTRRRFCSVLDREDIHRSVGTDNSSIENSDKFEIQLSHIFPLFRGSLTTSNSATVDSNSDTVSMDSNELEREQVVPITSENILSSIKHRYEKLPKELFKIGVIGKDTQEILGYLLEDLVSIPAFVSTKQQHWSLKLDDLAAIRCANIDASKVVKVVTLKNHNNDKQHVRFGSDLAKSKSELEDGEEVEEDTNNKRQEPEDKDCSISLLDKIQRQAVHWLFSDVTISNTNSQTLIGQKRTRSSIDSNDSSVISPHSFSLPLDVAAIDCEMCETSNGLELARVTILHPSWGIVLDTLVKPAMPIANYHTEFSGITEDQLAKVDISLKDVQNLLRVLISKDTILIGHSFDNDLRALQLFHDRIIDTSALFLHPSGFPYKHSLKKVTKDVLDWDIQDGSDGHDSMQDAAAAMLLAIAKVEEEMAFVDGTSEKNSLRALLGSRHYHERYNLRHTVASAASIFSDIYAPIPRYSWFQHSLPTPSAFVRFSVIAHPPIQTASRWEREGLGYPAESDPLQAIAEEFFANREHYDRNGHQILMRKVDSWFGAFEEAKEQFATHHSQENASSLELKSITWISVAVSNGNGDGNGSTVTNATSLEENSENDSKRGRYEPAEKRSNKLSSVPELQEIDNELKLLYESLPTDSKLVVVMQRPLLPLRKLIAKKLRRRWDMQSAAKKRTRVAMPSKVANFEWDNQLDENKLLEEANAVARCCLFVRYK